MAVLRDSHRNQTIPLQGKLVLIGRDPCCHIPVNNRRTSWQHAMILHLGDGYWIEDLGSANGTYVNGQRIGQRTRLQPGDQIEVWGLTAVFQTDIATTPGPGRQPTLVGFLQPGLAEGGAAKEQLPSILSSVLVGDLHTEVEPQAKLRAILEISRQLSNTLNLDEVLPRILDSLFSVFPQAERGFVLLTDAVSGQLLPKATKHRRGPPGQGLEISHSIVQHVVNTGRAILSVDAGCDERFDPSHSVRQLGFGSVLCVPMMTPANTCLGVIQLDTRNPRTPFRQEDLEVLVSACTQAARAVEYARLHQELRELEAAQRIQKSFLPSEAPQLEGLCFFHHYAAARQVGGDYFDYIALPGQRLALTVGDVSGKGVAAALLMARLSAAVRFALVTEPTLPSVVSYLNRMFIRAENSDRFITFLVAILDRVTYQLTVVNAGHPPPLLRHRNGSVESMGEQAVGLPLALFDQPYEQVVVPFDPGDTLVLYTDGITEARSPQREFFGPQRLQAIVQATGADVDVLGAVLLSDLRQFVADRPPRDDLTVVCCRRAG